MSAAIIAATKKIIVYLLSNSETRSGVVVAIGSIIAGLLGLMCLPALVTMALQNRNSELPEIDKSMFNEAAYFSSLDSSQQAELMNLQAQGQAIENAMTAENVRSQTIKAQLIYLSHFENVQDFDAEFYAKLFAASPDDESLINVLNYAYRLDIDYAEFMRTYVFVMNATINQYMFETPEIKNGTDLAAWAENAYISGWGYKENTVGDRDEESRIRCADSAGMILGYLRYDTEQKVFNSEPSNLNFNSKGGLGTMPDEAGVILSDGENYGVYVGNGEVIFASKQCGYVTKDKVSNGAWNSWSKLEEIYHGTEIVFEEYDENIKNNLGLVRWAIQAHDNGWGYVYGTYGNVLTEELLQDRASVFGGEVTSYMDFIRENWLGKRTADCVGLIKGYGWYDAESDKIIVGSNGMKDVTANGMFEAATVKGTIDTIPEVPGLAVWSDGHIGIYIGNGEVVEAMNTLRGVTRTKLAGR